MADDDWRQAIRAAGAGGGSSSTGQYVRPAAGGLTTVYMGHTDSERRAFQLAREVKPAKNTSRNPNVMAAVAGAQGQIRGGYGFVGNYTQDDVQDIEAMRGQVYDWYGTDEFARWGDRLVDLGLVDKEDSRDIDVLDKWWQTALETSARFYRNGEGKKITPWKALEALASLDEDGKALRGGGGRGGQALFSGTKTHRSRSIDLTDPMTARALVNRTLAQALGRDAGDEELEAFKAALNAYERKNPLLTTTNTTYKEGEAVSSSSTSTGGVTDAGRQELLLQEAMEAPEYGAYQAASTYINALYQAIQSPV